MKHSEGLACSAEFIRHAGPGYEIISDKSIAIAFFFSSGIKNVTSAGDEL